MKKTKITLKEATSKRINMILCNNAPMLDKTLNNSFNQYFLTDLSLSDFNYYQDKFPELELVYSETLDLFSATTSLATGTRKIESIDLLI